MNTFRIVGSGLLAAAWLVLSAAPALAHPVTGGESSPAQVALTVVGGLITVGAVVAAIKADPAAPRRGRLPNARNSSMIAVVLGLAIFMFGPDLLEPALSPCERPATDAGVTIVSPESGQTVQGVEVQLDVDLQGGDIASLSSTENREDEGHLHISIDDKLASMTGAAQQTLQVEPGDHVLEVEFVANDHSPFCTRVADRVRFSVANPG